MFPSLVYWLFGGKVYLGPPSACLRPCLSWYLRISVQVGRKEEHWETASKDTPPPSTPHTPQSPFLLTPTGRLPLPLLSVQVCPPITTHTTGLPPSSATPVYPAGVRS